MTKTITKPEIGAKGCYSIGGDAYPVTVIAVTPSGNKVTVRYEKFKGDIENGHEYYGQQKWIIEEDPKGRTETFSWHPSNKAYRQGGCGWLRFNGWFAKQDPSF